MLYKGDRYNLGKEIKDLIAAPDSVVYEHYIVKDILIEYTDESLKEEFLKILYTSDSKNYSKYPRVLVMEGVNLNHFWGVIYHELFPVLPKNYHLNLRSIIGDFEYLLGQNVIEAARARVQHVRYENEGVPMEEREPTDFVVYVTDLICQDLITDRAFPYMFEQD